MKAIITSKKIKVSALVMLILFNLTSAEGLRGDIASEFRPVDSNRIPEILTMISSRIKSNYDKIKTWQVEEDFTIYRIYEGAKAERIFNTRTDGTGKTPNTVIRRIEGKHQFAVDLEKDFLYANMIRENPPYYMDLETGRDLGAKSAPSQKVSILTPEYYINWGPYAMRDGVVMSRRVVKQARQKGLTCTNLSPPVSDPRESFMVGQPIWETFPPLVQYINEHGKYGIDGYSLKVEGRTIGNLTEYRIQRPGKVSPERYLLVTMVFSSKKGFNIVSYEVTDPNGKVFQQLTWEYELVSGVYLPKKTTEQIFELENGGLSYEAKYTFKNTKTNHHIPEETFTYKNLGLKNGDKFIDKILDKEFTYQDGDLIPVSSGSSRIFKQVNPTADLNGDCCMDWEDLIILASHWLES